MLFRRRNYFIKKKFQMSFLSGFILLLVLESILIGGLFMHASTNTLTTGYFDSVLRVERTSDFFYISFLLITFIVVIGMGIIGMVVFVLLSHRIAGPLYRFEKTLEAIESGDLTTRISLRKKDEITELKSGLNAAIDSLDIRLGKIKNGLIDLRSILKSHSPADQEAMQTLNAVIDSLENELGHFKVSSDNKG